jgi:hypothetical protein
MKHNGGEITNVDNENEKCNLPEFTVVAYILLD